MRLGDQNGPHNRPRLTLFLHHDLIWHFAHEFFNSNMLCCYHFLRCLSFQLFVQSVGSSGLIWAEVDLWPLVRWLWMMHTDAISLNPPNEPLSEGIGPVSLLQLWLRSDRRGRAGCRQWSSVLLCFLSRGPSQSAPLRYFSQGGLTDKQELTSVLLDSAFVQRSMLMVRLPAWEQRGAAGLLSPPSDSFVLDSVSDGAAMVEDGAVGRHYRSRKQ